MAEVHHHDHSHGHAHSHSDVFHSHAPSGQMRFAFFLTFCVLVIEIVGGIFSHSLALLSDAGHVLTDLAAIGLSWYALTQAERPSNQTMTFGYYRAGILAALLNGISLILITVWILWEAFGRFQSPQPIDSTWMFVSAGVGLLVNLYLGLRMRHDHDLNVRSAMLHMFGDAAASAGVIVGGVVIAATGWYTVDPLLSVCIALLIAFGAWRIVKQTVVILMEGTPKDVDLSEVIRTIRNVPGVRDVHDLHVWSITSGNNALSCHVVMDGANTVRECQTVLRDIEHRLVHLNIGHVTVQVEDQSHPHEDSVLCCSPGNAEDHVHSEHHH